LPRFWIRAHSEKAVLHIPQSNAFILKLRGAKTYPKSYSRLPNRFVLEKAKFKR